MKNRKRTGKSSVILFVIFLIIITVFAWKSCLKNSDETGIMSNEKEFVLITLIPNLDNFGKKLIRDLSQVDG